MKAAAVGSLRVRLKARLRRGAESRGFGDAMGEGRGLAGGGAVLPQISEPFRAGSRTRCRSMHAYAVSCRALSVTRRYCLRRDRLPKLRVAGSIPVSRSKI